MKRRSASTYVITHDHGDELDQPVQLELPEDLFDRYVARLADTSEDGDVEAALGLVEVHIDATIQSAAVAGRTVRAIGVRKGRISTRPRWFEVEDPAPPRPSEAPNPHLRWGS